MDGDRSKRRGMRNVLEASLPARQEGSVQFVKRRLRSAGDQPKTDDPPLRWSGMPLSFILYCDRRSWAKGWVFYHQRYGLDFLALRYSAIYGERQHKRAIAGSQMVEAYENVRSGKLPVIERDGKQVQDYIYVGDPLVQLDGDGEQCQWRRHEHRFGR